MPSQIDGSIFYTCTDVAQACAVSRQTIWRWRQDGLIPSGRTNRTRSVVFTESEMNYIRAHATQPDASRDAKSRTIYLDNAASTRPLDIVRDAVMRAMDVDFGNPSSAHGTGRRARQIVEDARDQVASLAGADRSHVHFTSGGTEANNWILQGAVRSGIRRIITTAVEHSSILGVAEALRSQGVEVVILPVDNQGRIAVETLDRHEIDTATLVSIQWANNETGVMQPVLEAAALVKARGGRTHSDAAQAIGKMAIDFASSPLDAVTFTAHKIHGPQGIGAAITKPTLAPGPILFGGSQEHGRRVGTENYPGIAGFGVAAEHRHATLRTFIRQTRALRDMFEARLRESIANVQFNGGLSDRVCTTGNVLIHGIDGQALVAQLDAKNVRISQSSACTNMRPEPSYVLRAMGLNEEQAYASIRYAVSEDTSFEACERAAGLIIESAIRLGAEPRRVSNSPTHKEVA